MSGIRENIERVKERIESVCRRVDRDPNEITLVCVTKTIDIARINEAIGWGITDIGENRIQESKTKFGKLSRPVKWHMVGHLQTNKAKDAVRMFDLIHSIDSLKIAEAIDRRAGQLGRQVDCLIEVNTSGEASKFGVMPDEVFGLVEEMAKLNNLRIKGLMTMAPLVDDPELARPYFRELKSLSEQVESRNFSNVQMQYLSMGMTQDFEVAVEEGSNMVRIGTAIFGPRGG